MDDANEILGVRHTRDLDRLAYVLICKGCAYVGCRIPCGF